MKVIYTAIAGNKDTPLVQTKKWPGWTYCIFIDDKTKLPKNHGWDTVRSIQATSDDFRYMYRRAAKAPKVLSNLYFPDAEYTIWMDGTHTVKSNPDKLVEKYLSTGKYFATFKHPSRKSLFEEAKVIKKLGLDHHYRVDSQINHYKTMGFKEGNYGLPATTVLLRKNSQKLNAVELAWWEQINRFSSRDQLSLPYVFTSMFVWDIHNYIPGHWRDNNLIGLVKGHKK